MARPKKNQQPEEETNALGFKIDKIYVDEIEEKKPQISPFDFITSISSSKENLMIDEWSENQYNPYLINLGLSYSPDTIFYANEMNINHSLSKKQQYNFLLEAIRPKKRFNKWIKAEPEENLKLIQDYFNYGLSKARKALEVLSYEDIENIKMKMNKGGKGK